MIDLPPAPEEQHATLLIRAWTEPSMPQALRARLLTIDEEHVPIPWSTAVGDAAISQEVLRWLRSAPHLNAAKPSGAAELPLPEGAGSIDAPLVSTPWMQEHLDDADVVVVEVDDDEHRYDCGHLPGAVRLDWQKDLQHPTRRMFLDQDAFTSLMDGHGITPDSHVIFYGDRHNMRAAAAYWYFAYYGHRRLSLLDGGRASWVSERRHLTTVLPNRARTTGYPSRPGLDEILLTRDQLLAGLVGAPPGTALVDCREPSDYEGRPERPYDQPVDRHRVPGRIPGAVNLPSEELSDPVTHRLLPLPQLRELFTRLRLTPEDQVVVYCGVADRSALVWYVLHELLGWPDVRCYVGAWAEYGSLSDVPVEAGRGARI